MCRFRATDFQVAAEREAAAKQAVVEPLARESDELIVNASQSSKLP